MARFVGAEDMSNLSKGFCAARAFGSKNLLSQRGERYASHIRRLLLLANVPATGRGPLESGAPRMKSERMRSQSRFLPAGPNHVVHCSNDRVD